MLQNTFCHINGVGQKTEARFWQAGIRSWPDFNRAEIPAVSASKAALIAGELHDSQVALQKKDPVYFSRRLPADQHWRIFGEFCHSTAYIDIETTGLGFDSSRITTIALYDGSKIRYYVNGINLERFAEDISCYDLVVTYNGKTFDIPFIERFFGIRMTQAHVDLRYVLKSLGYKGGLKGCEKCFGLHRSELEGVDGFMAVVLWHEYERNGDPRVLETLLAYNIEDVINLEHLMHAAYNLKVEDTPFSGQLKMELPQRPLVPFVPDAEVLCRIKNQQVL
ncbi:MAG: ribonuclease H-like domain-containing protein [Thermodesulfobacteriota bacterium]